MYCDGLSNDTRFGFFLWWAIKKKQYFSNYGTIIPISRDYHFDVGIWWFWISVWFRYSWHNWKPDRFFLNEKRWHARQLITRSYHSIYHVFRFSDDVLCNYSSFNDWSFRRPFDNERLYFIVDRMESINLFPCMSLGMGRRLLS